MSKPWLIFPFLHGTYSLHFTIILVQFYHSKTRIAAKPESWFVKRVYQTIGSLAIHLQEVLRIENLIRGKQRL